MTALLPGESHVSKGDTPRQRTDLHRLVSRDKLIYDALYVGEISSHDEIDTGEVSKHMAVAARINVILQTSNLANP